MAKMTVADRLPTGLREWPAGRTSLAPACLACGTPVHAGSPVAAPPWPVAAALSLARKLTPRERTVFELLGSGYDNRTIARELTISERTVKRYVTAILMKLELESRLQAGLTALLLSVYLGRGE